uniref:Uncharacterized protein n=1 Tax=Oryza nivara TaxID=4536 RepID=A0A0E0FNW4_ORYNI
MIFGLAMGEYCRSCVAHVKESWVQCWNAITSTVLKCILTQPQARNTMADNENTKVKNK